MSSFAFHKRAWHPIFRQQNTNVLYLGSNQIKPWPKKKQLADCPNLLCDGNCPMCPPCHELPTEDLLYPQPSSILPCSNWDEIIAQEFDRLILDANMVIGLYASTTRAITLFETPKSFCLATHLPFTIHLPELTDLQATKSSPIYLAGKYIVLPMISSLQDQFYARLIQRLRSILEHHLLADEQGKWIYAFGSYEHHLLPFVTAHHLQKQHILCDTRYVTG